MALGKVEVALEMGRDALNDQVLVCLSKHASRFLPVDVSGGAAVREDDEYRKLFSVSHQIRPVDSRAVIVAEPVQLHAHRKRPVSRVGQDRLAVRPLPNRLTLQPHTRNYHAFPLSDGPRIRGRRRQPTFQLLEITSPGSDQRSPATSTSLGNAVLILRLLGTTNQYTRYWNKPHSRVQV